MHIFLFVTNFISAKMLNVPFIITMDESGFQHACPKSIATTISLATKYRAWNVVPFTTLEIKKGLNKSRPVISGFIDLS